MKVACLSLAILIAVAVSGQNNRDELPARYLDSVTIISYLRESTIDRLSNIHGMYNFAGKEN